MNVFCKLLYHQFISQLDNHLQPLQFSFQSQISSIESSRASSLLLSIRMIVKKRNYLCFFDFVKAFNSVEDERLIVTVKKRCVNPEFINLITKMYSLQVALMKLDEMKQLPIKKLRRMRKDCILSPFLLSTYAYEAFKGKAQIPGIEQKRKHKLD